jgi:hypothetical protein
MLAGEDYNCVFLMILLWRHWLVANAAYKEILDGIEDRV